MMSRGPCRSKILVMIGNPGIRSPCLCWGGLWSKKPAAAQNTYHESIMNIVLTSASLIKQIRRGREGGGCGYGG